MGEEVTQTELSAAPVQPVTKEPTPVEQPSLLERAEKVRDATIEAEQRIDTKISAFEKKMAESILSGRSELIPTKNQEEKDAESAAATVSKFFD